jgi:hypothetical protein
MIFRADQEKKRNGCSVPLQARIGQCKQPLPVLQLCTSCIWCQLTPNLDSGRGSATQSSGVHSENPGHRNTRTLENVKAAPCTGDASMTGAQTNARGTSRCSSRSQRRAGQESLMTTRRCGHLMLFTTADPRY